MNTQMMLITANVETGVPEQPTFKSFRLIPIVKDSAYIEAIFNPNTKVLLLINKEKYSTHQMLKKLDEKGEPIKVIEKQGKHNIHTGYKQERKAIETFYDVTLENREDIEKFVSVMTDSEHNLNEYFLPFPVQKTTPPVPPEQLEEMKPAMDPSVKLEIVKEGE